MIGSHRNHYSIFRRFCTNSSVVFCSGSVQTM